MMSGNFSKKQKSYNKLNSFSMIGLEYSIWMGSTECQMFVTEIEIRSQPQAVLSRLFLLSFKGGKKRIFKKADLISVTS